MTSATRVIASSTIRFKKRPRWLPPFEAEIEECHRLLARSRARKVKVNLTDDADLESLFDSQLNSGVRPETVSRNCNHKVVWSCNAYPGETHIWLAAPANLARTIATVRSRGLRA